jgi:carbonic anhydrase/acetyltransferase-like protein (isoleucine patch superfamily)
MSIGKQRNFVPRGMMIRALVPVYLGLIAGAPLAMAILPVVAAPSPSWRIATLLVAVPIYCAAYVVIAGLLSRLTLRSIVAGKYPRDVSHDIYGPRRLYALCWTAIYYCAPIYHAVLAVPILKRAVFRLFGYRGSLNFQTYPDTWIRDLPLLTIGEGAYLSNKATVSPNMCLRNGKIIVIPVTIGPGTMIGHLTMIAPGVEIGSDSEVGVGAAVGVNVRIGSRTLVDHEVVIDHDVVIGDRCVVGTRAYIGRKAVVGNGVRVPPGAIVPARCVLATQLDVEALTADVSWRFPALSLER